jgi:PhoPQ-activated pathogenicity-related protein
VSNRLRSSRASVLFLAAVLAACGERSPREPAGLEHRTAASAATPLDAYVRAPDPSYAFRPIAHVDGEGYVTHVLEMTSQTWRAPDEVDRTLWKHWLFIVVPDGASSRTALLYLTGGSNDDPPPADADPARRTLALATHAVVAELRMVPNEPLLFAGESESRREDGLIAYGWDQFLRRGDPLWLPQLPMTKSAVRAMDTVTAFCASADGGGLVVDRFVVAGRSKRGWTSWTTAAVDDRVVAVVPVVIDLLNLEQSFRHHYDVYGFWSPAIGNYTKLGIPDWFGTPEMAALAAIIEPYSYRARLTLPKLIVNATGDPFFQPDSSRLYFAELPGEKLLRYVPNAGHDVEPEDLLASLVPFYRAIVENAPLPSCSWSFEGNDTIVVRGVEPRASSARVWQASNPAARDFRIDTLGPAWTSRELASEKDGAWVARIAPPREGWTAFFVELTVPSDGDDPHILTTDVRVVPDTLPFAGTLAPGTRHRSVPKRNE